MSNILHVDFSNNSRTILTPRQRLICRREVLQFRPNKALEDERYSIMDEIQRAKEVRDWQHEALVAQLTYKQYGKLLEIPRKTYIDTAAAAKKVSKSAKIHDIADGLINAQRRLEALTAKYKNLTEQLEALGHWEKAQ